MNPEAPPNALIIAQPSLLRFAVHIVRFNKLLGVKHHIFFVTVLQKIDICMHSNLDVAQFVIVHLLSDFSVEPARDLQRESDRNSVCGNISNGFRKDHPRALQSLALKIPATGTANKTTIYACTKPGASFIVANSITAYRRVHNMQMLLQTVS